MPEPKKLSGPPSLEPKKSLYAKVRRAFKGPKSDMLIHKVMTWVWGVLAIPSVLIWKHSIPYLVFVSVYALFVGHYSAWQAAKAEKAQKPKGYQE